MNSRILIVEDEAKLREVLCDYFSSKGELPASASNGMQALDMLDENEFDAVLLDIMGSAPVHLMRFVKTAALP